MRKQKKYLALSMSLVLSGFCAAGNATASETFQEYLSQWGYDNPKLAQPQASHETQQTSLDVALRLDGTYFDGRWLYLGWSVENLRPDAAALVLHTQVLINGQPAWVEEDHPLATWSPNPFGLRDADHPLTPLTFYGARIDTKDLDLTDSAEITMRFVVKRPKQKIAVVDSAIYEPYEDAGMQRDHDAMVAAMREVGMTIAEQNALDPDAWTQQGYLVVDRDGSYYIDGQFYSEYELGELAEITRYDNGTGAQAPDMETQAVEFVFTAPLADQSQ